MFILTWYCGLNWCISTVSLLAVKDNYAMGQLKKKTPEHFNAWINWWFHSQYKRKKPSTVSSCMRSSVLCAVYKFTHFLQSQRVTNWVGTVHNSKLKDCRSNTLRISWEYLLNKVSVLKGLASLADSVPISRIICKMYIFCEEGACLQEDRVLKRLSLHHITSDWKK